MIAEGRVVVALLLTAEVLNDQHAMAEAAAAVASGQLLVPVMLVGRGYDYSTASAKISALQLDGRSEEEMATVGEQHIRANHLPDMV